MMANHRKKPKIHSVKFNVLMNMLLTTSQMLFPLITLPYVSRILSTFGTGAVAYVQSVVLYFSMVALLGIQNYGIKVCAMVRDDSRKGTFGHFAGVHEHCLCGLSVIDIPHSDFLSTADTVPDFLSWILAFFVRCGMVLPSH